MNPISTKTKLILVGAGYVLVLAFGTAAFAARYVEARNHPDWVAAAGGMYAAGDTLLAIFVALLLMIPTFFLIWVGGKFEAYYTTYSKTLLIFGCTAPLCLALLVFANTLLPGNLVVLCFVRLFWSPFVLALEE